MVNKITTLFLLLCSLSVAGEYHQQSDVACSDCHTTHYSERGTIPENSEPGGPFPELLRVGSIDRLCLSCHDGTDPSAPDVMAPVVMYNGSGSEFSGAGFFSVGDGVISVNGHDLGVPTEIPYSNPPRTVILSCVSCHDAHGTANYRNLVLDPDSLGADISLTLGSDVFEAIHPGNPPERNGSIQAYRSGNIGYSANAAEWCTDCHNALLLNGPGTPPAHFMRHPSEVGLEGVGYHLAPAHWVGGAGDGFGVATGDAAEGIPRLRFQAPGASDFLSATTPSVTNQVFCPTCHFAHGGPFKSSLTWPYQTAGVDLYSGCQQCHFK
ncbi:MAG TPA: hypothetical protein DEO84_01540 [candidate division Zixibacteria bacterium]|nr:hypothetical protein [candidate division Zixibacteria bacterium]